MTTSQYQQSDINWIGKILFLKFYFYWVTEPHLPKISNKKITDPTAIRTNSITDCWYMVKKSGQYQLVQY